jgi:hypothetical protein
MLLELLFPDPYDEHCPEDLPFFRYRNIVFHGALSQLLRTKTNEKAAAHIRNSGLRPDAT